MVSVLILILVFSGAFDRECTTCDVTTLSQDVMAPKEPAKLKPQREEQRARRNKKGKLLKDWH